MIKKKTIVNLIGFTVVTALIGAIVAGVGIVYILNHYGRDLPDYKQLAKYEPPIITRIYANDGSLLGEYARQKRLFIPITSFELAINSGQCKY